MHMHDISLEVPNTTTRLKCKLKYSVTVIILQTCQIQQEVSCYFQHIDYATAPNHQNHCIGFINLLLFCHYWYGTLWHENKERLLQVSYTQLLMILLSMYINIKINFLWFSDTTVHVGRYYTGNGSNVYYLNSFDHLPRSYGKHNKVIHIYIRMQLRTYVCVCMYYAHTYVLQLYETYFYYQATHFYS